MTEFPFVWRCAYRSSFLFMENIWKRSESCCQAIIFPLSVCFSSNNEDQRFVTHLTLNSLHLLGKERIQCRIMRMNLVGFPCISLINFGLKGAWGPAVILLTCYLIFFSLHPQNLLEEDMCQFRRAELHLVQGFKPGKFLSKVPHWGQRFSFSMSPTPQIFTPALKQISIFFFSVTHQMQQLEKYLSFNIRVTLSTWEAHTLRNTEDEPEEGEGPQILVSSPTFISRDTCSSTSGGGGRTALHLHCYCVSLCNGTY